MKVLQVLNTFLPQQTAGTEIYTWALSKCLQEQGIDVQVVIPHYGQKFDFAYEYDGLKIHMYAEPSTVDRSLIMGFRPPDGLNNFLSFLNQHRPDIVHFHELAGSNGITLRHIEVAKQAGAKVVMTFHLSGYSCKTGTLVHNGKELCDGVINIKKCSNCYLYSRGYNNIASYLTNISTYLNRSSINTTNWSSKLGTALGIANIIAKLKADLIYLINTCDRIVTITDFYKQILLANGIDEKKITYISQGLPLGSPIEKLHGIRTQGPLHILFLGRINKLKGLHLLIEAIRAFDVNLVQLTVYGSSDDSLYEKSLRKLSMNQANIHWKGELKQVDVLSTMKQHDILFLGSTFSEMSPLVIQESFAAKIPVIASKVYGNIEQIKDGVNGLLFNFNDMHDLRKKINRCIIEPNLLDDMAKNIGDPFLFSRVARSYIELYKNLLV